MAFSFLNFGFRLPNTLYLSSCKRDSVNGVSPSASTVTTQAVNSTPIVRRRGSFQPVILSDGTKGTNLNQQTSVNVTNKRKGIKHQLTSLFNTMSPIYRVLLCTSATVHLSSTFLRFAISTWFPIMLRGYEDHYNVRIINLFITNFELGGILGNLLAGFLSDFGSSQPSSLFLNPRMPFILGQMLIACALLCALCITVPLGIPSIFLILAALLLGLTVFGAISLCGILAVELAPASLSGTSHALTALCANVGCFMAGYPISRLSDLIGWVDAFSLSGFLCAFTLVPMSLLCSRRLRRLIVQ